MMICGVQLEDGEVSVLANRLDRSGATATGGRLRRALFITAVGVRLEAFEQREVIAALAEDCPSGLTRLRDELVRQESFRTRHAPPSS